ncbi:hypothetical protein [Ruminococcus sp. XPD3002]|jgi:hypothetical protein|uniref:hypothetical protein n=1 Tax=Ruminococcus sp. XPD3002 TaxID=1452269 RepID=UPI000920DE79|nr:hypothetical protein SAMN04487832_105182 [Ruminococcus flavefaciens]
MKRKVLSNKLSELNKELVTDLKSALDYELEKPFEKWNVTNIINLSNAIADIKGYTLSEEDVKRRTDSILSEVNHIISGKEGFSVDRNGLMQDNS